MLFLYSNVKIVEIMAWLQNLAGRAEDLLNKIDQNAATVLNENPKTGDIEVQIQDPIKDPTQENGYETNRKIATSSSFNVLPRNLSFQSTPVNVGEKLMPEEAYSIEEFEGGIVFDVASENQTPTTVIVGNDDYSTNKSLRSSAKSDQMSSSSSLHNSFILAEQSQLFQEKIAKLEFENQDLNKQLLNMQHLYSEIRNENTNLQAQVERSNEQVSAAQMEKDQYIARAQRILQEKEKLISLKKEDSSTEEAENIFATYNEELMRELEFHQEKNHELTQKNIEIMKDVQSLQMQHQIIQNGLQQFNQNLEQSLASERNMRSMVEEDCLQINRELHLKNQELFQLQELMKVKNNEITQLKETIKQKATTNVNEDMESRIKFLTQTLMLKQNNLETAITERNALRLQLEKLESEFKKSLAQLNRAQVKVVNVQDSEDSIAIPQFMRVSPFDAGVTRRVKRAYSTLDAVSIRTGIFLRRYPVARVFVFCYMVLLHIWVLIILFLYAPSNR